MTQNRQRCLRRKSYEYYQIVSEYHQDDDHKRWRLADLRDYLRNSVGDVLPLYLDSRSDPVAGPVHLRVHDPDSRRVLHLPGRDHRSSARSKVPLARDYDRRSEVFRRDDSNPAGGMAAVLPAEQDRFAFSGSGRSAFAGYAGPAESSTSSLAQSAVRDL